MTLKIITAADYSRDTGLAAVCDSIMAAAKIDPAEVPVIVIDTDKAKATVRRFATPREVDVKTGELKYAPDVVIDWPHGASVPEEERAG